VCKVAANFSIESEPISNRAGALALYICPLCCCVQKRGECSPVYKYMRFGVNSINKTESRQKFTVTIV
jgi:hypothetical protein